MARLTTSALLITVAATSMAVSVRAEPVTSRIGTTRILERPVYGATMTMEQGVRVIRPLPPTHHVVVNPHGRTPLSLSYQDVRVSEERTVHQHAAPVAAQSPAIDSVAAPVVGWGAYRFRHHGPHTPHARSPHDRGR